MTVLLLAGTSEAKRIAWGLSDKGVSVIASLAGVTRRPDPLPVPTRIGGFGGEDGFRRFLKAKAITAVLDATHPFAEEISNRTVRVCEDLGLPYVNVERPKWTAQDGDKWSEVNAPEDVAPLLPDNAVVFLATGTKTLAKYKGLGDLRVLVRMIDPPREALPFETWECVIGRPPFSPDREEALFKALGVTHLVAKNAGGQGGRGKIDAARAMGLPVILLARPAPPSGYTLPSVEAAVEWVKKL